jgi:hypothetical protein
MHNRKVLKTAVDNLDKAKAPAKPKDIIRDPLGQWKYPGQNTRIPASNITMKGVNYPVLAQPNVGQPQMMYPGQEYQFPGADYVDEFPQGNSDDYIDAELTDEEIEQYRKGGYIVEDISIPQLTKAQKGYSTPTYADSLFLYNNSLELNKWMSKNDYHWTDLIKYDKSKSGFNPDKIYQSQHLIYSNDKKLKQRTHPFNSYVTKKGDFVGSTDWAQGAGDDIGLPFTWRHPGISPQKEGDMAPINNKAKPSSYSYRYDPIAIKPGKLLTDAEIKTRLQKYGTIGIPTSRLTALNIPFKSNKNNKPERKPLPEIGKLQIRGIQSEKLSPEIVPQTFNYTPKKQEPIQVANRSQTVMEADPNREDKYRMKEMRQVPYSAKFPGEANWEPANAPRVIYVDAEGNETEERPELIQQKKGGSLKKYSRSLEATNKVFHDSPLLKKVKSKKKKIFDPKSNYFDVGGIPNLPLREGRKAYERLGYTDNDRMAMAAEGGSLELELTQDEIQSYIDAGYTVEDI